MTLSPRVAIAGIFIESNAFCPPFRFTPEEGSAEFLGQALLDDARAEQPRVHKEVQGFVRRMDETTDWQPQPILFAGMKPAGPVDQAKVDGYLRQILDGLRAAMPLDAVYICNHGAMTATEDLDIEATIATAIRREVGTIPVVATLDLHGNISQAHVDALDLAVSYREDPHYDQFRTGTECADGLIEILAGCRTLVANRRLPIVAPNVSLATFDGPYGELIELGQSLIDRRIMNVSILAGFAYSDTPKNGMHVIVTARRDQDPDGAYAREVVERLTEWAWSNRMRFDWDLTPIEEAVSAAVKAGEDDNLPPVFMVDLGDNAGAGGPARSLWMLQALHRAGARDALVACFHDPVTAAEAHRRGPGARFHATLTGDDWEGGPASFSTPVEVLALSDGHCVGRRGISAGRKLYAGPSALLRAGSVLITVNTRHTTMNDPAYVEMLGIGPGDFRSIVLKGRGSNYLAAWGDYFPPATPALYVDVPGRTSPVLTRFDWTALPRPVWPIDRDTAWHPEPVAVHV